jgi:hydrogenase/urease accessory protein HupE
LRVWIYVLCMVCANASLAHEARPLAVTITDQGGHSYRVLVRIPDSVATDNQPRVVYPQDCKTSAQQRIQCARALDGRTLSIAYPLYNPAISTLVRFEPASGGTRTAVLPPDISQWSVPEDPGALAVARDYFALGVNHILGGADHLLFVAGLLLIARRSKPIFLAVTGFTIAHSLTLSLAALGVIHVPAAPTEVVIALSILFLAREALRGDAWSLLRRFPMLVSGLFGLLHGLGFAAALGDVGLPKQEIVIALLFFNLGVEVGQLAFILVVVALAACALRFWRKSKSEDQVISARFMRIAAYAIGIPAAFWFIQRLTSLDLVRPMAHALTQ